jgi:hypothetical protein
MSVGVVLVLTVNQTRQLFNRLAVHRFRRRFREGSHIFDIQPDVRLETFSFRENNSSKGIAFLIPSSPVNARLIGRSRLSQKLPIARRQSRALRKTLAQVALKPA